MESDDKYTVWLNEKTLDRLDELIDDDVRFAGCETYEDAVKRLIELYGGSNE